MTGKLRIAVSSDFFDAAGNPKFPEFDPSQVNEWSDATVDLLDFGDEAPEGSLAGYDALVLLRPKITAKSLVGADRLALIARFGVGYERVDVEACTRASVAVAITPNAVRRPVAVAEMTLLLALASRLTDKHRIARGGASAWAERTQFNGIGLVGRTLGSIGLGNIGSELFRLAAPFGMVHAAYDPYASSEQARELAVELVGLDEVLSRSDFVVVNCPLTSQTHGLIGAREIARMRPSAFLINTARGGIVDEGALADALSSRRIAGAGVDVFEVEPPPDDNPLLGLDNVILAPHSLAWTDQNFLGIGKEIITSIAALRRGEAPGVLVNRDVLSSQVWLNKVAQITGDPMADRNPTDH